MKISRNDWLFIALAGVVLIVFLVISGPEKTKKVPYNDKHQQFYDIVKKTGSKMEADKGCPACHNEQRGIPFPAKHPVKPKDGPMRCLFCHKLQTKTYSPKTGSMFNVQRSKLTPRTLDLGPLTSNLSLGNRCSH